MAITRIVSPPKEVLSTSEPDQLAPNQHSTDLVGARADVEQLGVAVIAFDRPILGVACAAERLHSLVGDLHRILAREQDRTGGVVASGLAFVARPGDLVHVSAR